MIKILGQQKLQQTTYTPPGDKSISHRAAILGAMGKEELVIENFAQSKDCFSTLACLKEMGVPIKKTGDNIVISKWDDIPKGRITLDCGNSGTTARLLPAVLGGLGINGVIIGDNSLSSRPMDRIVEPLKKLGGVLKSSNGKLPIIVEKGWQLKGDIVSLDVASAQLKTAILLAGLFSDGNMTVIEPQTTRNHTEIMLKEFGITVKKDDNKISVIDKGEITSPKKYRVVGDFSSAAYFIAIGLLSKEKTVQIRDVGLNETRTAFLDVVKKMGGKLEVTNTKLVNGEIMGDIHVYPSDLNGIDLNPKLVPNLIDELPLLAVIAAYAQGTTKVTKARELRVKESDRISAIITCLKELGAHCVEYDDGFEIIGGKPLKGKEVYCQKDHRIIMSMAVAALFAEGETTISDSQWVDISNTAFFKELRKVVVI